MTETIGDKRGVVAGVFSSQEGAAVALAALVEARFFSDASAAGEG